MVLGRHFEFEAAHFLPDVGTFGRCSRMHGHRYELTVEIEGPVNSDGWICDFKELKGVVQEQVLDRYDHSNLNDHFEVSTVENIASQIFSALTHALDGKPYWLKKIKLYETRNCYAEITAN
ncbi:6-pyruvoyl trahydropterin synthase family protein [Paenibacillus curdlanolyticus]|nr:6-carboxytetrahydropterin synthase [Paenibacillus curdlanolyticus]